MTKMLMDRTAHGLMNRTKLLVRDRTRFVECNYFNSETKLCYLVVIIWILW